MSSVNKVLLIGNLCADPEVRTTQNGKSVVNFTLATNESWKDKSTGEKKERAEFHRVVIFSEGLCRVAEAYLKKGSKVYLEGQLQTRKWEKDGIDRYSTEVVLQGFSATLVMLDGRRDDQQRSINNSDGTTPTGVAQDGYYPPDDSIPF